MTLCVKDEEDVLDAQLAFHLAAGVDFVIATDTGSTDGSLDILERYSRDGVLELRRDHSQPFLQGRLRTEMAYAAFERGATWVFSSDADEFWWPRGASLRAVFDALPARYGVVFGIWRPFVPRLDDGTSFFERLIWRLAGPYPINDPASAFRPNVKVAHRAHRSAIVAAGAHSVSGVPFAPLRGWYPIEVLHFPMRSTAQMARKYAGALDYVDLDRSGKVSRYGTAATDRGNGQILGGQMIDDDALADGLAAGVLVEDTRLRDALRRLGARDDDLEPRTEPPQLEFGIPSAVEDSLFAADIARLSAANMIRTQRTLDELELRLQRVERAPQSRQGSRLRSLVLLLRPFL